jgi:hypothetical protein
MNKSSLDNAPRSPGFYALILGGLVAVGLVAAFAVSSGGLPGTHNSPTATIGGKAISGKTGSD